MRKLDSREVGVIYLCDKMIHSSILREKLELLREWAERRKGGFRIVQVGGDCCFEGLGVLVFFNPIERLELERGVYLSGPYLDIWLEKIKTGEVN